MPECISGGAKLIISDLLEKMEPEDTKGYVKRILVKLEKMPVCKNVKGKRKFTGPRKVSKWTQCIKQRRTGKKFDPDAIRALAIEYKAGKCPS